MPVCSSLSSLFGPSVKNRSETSAGLGSTIAWRRQDGQPLRQWIVKNSF